MFLKPVWLLTAAVLPLIVILHFRSKQVVEYRVSWLECWEETIQAEQGLRISRLSQYIPLILQLFFGTLLVLAAAEPVRSHSLPEETITLALDASISMGAVEDGASRFDAARGEIRRLIQSLPEQSRINLILLNDGVREKVRDASPRQALEAVEQVECGLKPLDTALACGQLQSYPAPVIVITDKDLNGGDRLINIGGNLDNVGITGASYDYYSGSVTFTASNYSVRDRLATISLWDGNRKVDAVSIALAAGGKGSGSLKAGDPGETLAVKVEEQDMLEADNVYLVAAGDSGRKKVMLRARDPFLEKALAAAADIRLDIDSGQEADPDGSQVVITTDPTAIYSLPPQTAIWVVLPGRPLTVEGEAPTAALQILDSPVTADMEPAVGLKAGNAGQLEAMDGFQTVLEADGKPVMSCGFQQGRRVVYSALRFADTNLVLNPVFPILVSNIIAWLDDDDTGKFDANPPPSLVVNDDKMAPAPGRAAQSPLFAALGSNLLAAALIMLLVEWEVYRRGL